MFAGLVLVARSSATDPFLPDEDEVMISVSSEVEVLSCM